MFLPGNRLKKSSGKIIKFSSAKKRKNWERVAQAYKHGWKGPESLELHLSGMTLAVERIKQALKDPTMSKQHEKSSEGLKALFGRLKSKIFEGGVVPPYTKPGEVSEEEISEMYSVYQHLEQLFEGMFMSLNTRMYDAVRAKFQDKYWLSDWDEKIVLLRPSAKSETSPLKAAEVYADQSEIYYQVGYKIDNTGAIVFEGEPKKVRREVIYVAVE